jgi:hypothetical protein
LGLHISDVPDPCLIDTPAIESAIQYIGSNWVVMIRVGRDSKWSLIHGTKTLSFQAVANAFVTDGNSAIPQAADNPWPTVAAFAALVYRRNLGIERRVGHRTITGFALSPLAVSGS